MKPLFSSHTDPVSIESRRPSLAVLSGPLIVAVTFVALTIWSWRKWSDILVDFGKELYIAWQLSIGKVLYSDIAYFNGPFSPYFNATLFRVFGVSTTTLIFGNLVILAIATGMIYLLFKRSCDRLTATVCCCIFLSVFGLAQLTAGGTYNFITPYTHEITHGVVLSIGMILCLVQYAVRGNKRFVALAGFLLGLVFLTKAEVFLAAAVSAGLGFALLPLVRPLPGRKTLAAIFIPSALLPSVLFFAFLVTHIPVHQALSGIAGTWGPIVLSNVTSIPFYREGAGLDMPFVRIVTMLRAFLAFVLLIGGIVAADVSRKLRSREKVFAVAVCVVCILLSALAKRSTDPWSDASGLPVPWLLIGTALPLVTLIAGSSLIQTLMGKAEIESKQRTFALVVWTSFAFALLAKIMLSSRLYHYGFALAMPATLSLIAICLRVIPDTLRRLNGGGDLFRRFVLAALIADTVFFVMVSNRVYGYKHERVGTGGDVMIVPAPEVDPRGVVVAKTLRRIDELVGKDQTFVVLPDGSALNYLTRRINPTPYLSFIPTEVAIFGETPMLDALQRNPPDFVLLPLRTASEFGVKPFGTDPSYGKEVMDWVHSHYLLVDDIDIGSESTIPFDIKILRRSTP